MKQLLFVILTLISVQSFGQSYGGEIRAKRYTGDTIPAKPIYRSDSSLFVYNTNPHVKVDSIGSVVAVVDSNSQRKYILIPRLKPNTDTVISQLYGIKVDSINTNLILTNAVLNDIDAYVTNLATIETHTQHSSDILDSIKGYYYLPGRTTLTSDKGKIMMGAVTASAPAYSTGQTNYLSLDAKGNIRMVQDTSLVARNLNANITRFKSSTDTVTTNTTQVMDLFVTGQGSQTTVGNNVILATAGAASYNTFNGSSNSYRSLSLQIVVSGTVSAGAINFEGSNDSTNYSSIYLYDANNPLVAPVASYSLATNTTRYWTGTIPFKFIRARIATGITGGATCQAFTVLRTVPYTQPTISIAAGTQTIGQVNTNVNSATALGDLSQMTTEDAASGNGYYGFKIVDVRADTLTPNGTSSANGDWSQRSVTKYGSSLTKLESTHKRSYSAAFTVVPASSCTDLVEIIGSSSKTVSINKIIISGTQTTGGEQTFYLKRRSTASTGGSSTTATLVPHEATDVAATSSIKIFTANPTTGSAVGDIRVLGIPIPATTATTKYQEVIDFGERSKPIILSGTSQTLCINLNGATLTGGSINISIEFTEE
jgi:hypothetical protein